MGSCTLHPAALPFTPGCRHFPPGCCRHYTWLPKALHPTTTIYTRLPKALHPAAATFHPVAKSFPPGCAAIYIRLPPLPLGCIASEILTLDGRGERFNFSGYTYPDPLTARIRRISQQFYIVPRCSPEASQYVQRTSLDIYL